MKKLWKRIKSFFSSKDIIEAEIYINDTLDKINLKVTELVKENQELTKNNKILAEQLHRIKQLDRACDCCTYEGCNISGCLCKTHGA